MTKLHILAAAAGLLVAISGPALAAQRHHRTSHGYSRNAVKTNPGNWNGWGYDSYARGTSAHPYGTGNLPYPDRPYGDPDRW